MTVGIYRPIRLLRYTARIANLNPVAVVSAALDCSLAVRATFRGDTKSIATVQVILHDPNNNNLVMQHERELQFTSAETEVELVKWTFGEDEVKLWWPVGYGEQARYVVDVTILGEVRRKHSDKVCLY